MKVSALMHTATAADVLNLTRATGKSRFPVYRDRIDEITGVVHLKDALAVPEPERARTTVGRISVAPLLVPGSLPVQPLLERLRSEQPMAVVVDEYGGTAGVVTLEDIVEELVGEVRDEHDLAEDDGPELAAVPAEDGRPSWEADGSCRVQTLRRIGLEVPEGPYETVAGLVADLLGRIPAPGDRAELPGWRLSVRQVGRNRAERVRLVRLTAVPAAGSYGTAPEAGRAALRGAGRPDAPAPQPAELEGAAR